MLLQIEGYHLPGRVWQSGHECYDNVHVGIQVGKQPSDLVRGDVGSASWSLPIEVVTVDGGLDFRGAAVQGRRGDRFVYLTWGTVDDGGSFAMFRRAKLMLADLAPLIGAATRVIARVDLTDDRGGPRCARLKPPALSLHRAD
ncbi:DUF5990 family protein [Mycobacterium sp. 3519A]|uniref:DUF5990 family protein n=1 Tax=Mycobacterium sp. 3519A TaxID=2057184 RepID=UPI000C79E143|nr:DUF5990 family protein [Mycobacterium sp. 3519A]